jgi:hypothetical protein
MGVLAPTAVQQASVERLDDQCGYYQCLSAPVWSRRPAVIQRVPLPFGSLSPSHDPLPSTGSADKIKGRLDLIDEPSLVSPGHRKSPRA